MTASPRWLTGHTPIGRRIAARPPAHTAHAPPRRLALSTGASPLSQRCTRALPLRGLMEPTMRTRRRRCRHCRRPHTRVPPHRRRHCRCGRHRGLRPRCALSGPGRRRPSRRGPPCAGRRRRRSRSALRRREGEAGETCWAARAAEQKGQKGEKGGGLGSAEWSAWTWGLAGSLERGVGRGGGGSARSPVGHRRCGVPLLPPLPLLSPPPVPLLPPAQRWQTA